MRLSLRAFAEHLGISFGTVAAWNRRGATVTPTPDMQAVLDTALARSSPEDQARFRTATATAGSGGGGPDQADISRSGLPDTRTSGRPVTGTDEVLLTVQVNGQPVTLPLEVVADVARTSAGGGVSLTGAVAGLRGPASRGRPVFASDERAIGARGYTSWRQYFAGWTTHSQALIDAFRDVDAALEVDPGSVVAHMTFIRACWDMGWHERALQAGRAVHERNPDSLDATVAFARALNNAGLAQYALPLVASVLADDPTHPAAVKLNVWCHLMVGDHTGTVEVSRDHLARAPGDANPRWAVALAAANLPGGSANAIGIARDGLAADPGDVTLWVLLGYLHRHTGDETAARQTWAQGADQIGADGTGISNPRTRAWLANLLAGVGQVDAVLETVGVLSDSEPNNGYLRTVSPTPWPRPAARTRRWTCWARPWRTGFCPRNCCARRALHRAWSTRRAFTPAFEDLVPTYRLIDQIDPHRSAR